VHPDGLEPESSHFLRESVPQWDEKWNHWLNGLDTESNGVIVKIVPLSARKRSTAERPWNAIHIAAHPGTPLWSSFLKAAKRVHNRLTI
jgi:hypothetical protein